MHENYQKKVPTEAIMLYNQFIHGEIPRREFLDGVKRYAVAGLTATAIVEALMPNYALGQQIASDDDRIAATYETVPSPNGNGSMRGLLVRPISADTRSETSTPLPGIIVIHENRGLNPHTEDVARRFALENFMAFAPDALSSVGGYPGDDYRGGEMFGQVDRERLTQDFINVSQWLKNRPDCTGSIGATGFCFGGGMVNTLATMMGEDMAAVAPFYGNAAASDQVASTRAAVLVHHGALDMRLAEGWAAQQADLQRAGVTHEGHIYADSVHGFFNDATPERYNKTAAELAWTRTIGWFNQHVRGNA
jgi:carboxymethylenebutenolidase